MRKDNKEQTRNNLANSIDECEGALPVEMTLNEKGKEYYAN